jgi:3D (Asp-Asp-Asp) domain-containing protein
MKSVFSGSAIIASSILLGSLILSATPSVAETQLAQDPAQTQKGPTVAVSPPAETASATPVVNPAINSAINDESPSPETAEASEEIAAAPAAVYVATAYSLRGRTASGRMVSKGIIAADPRILPLGSRVRLEAGGYSGEYLVADTGGAVRGKRIDIWIPTSREAFRFGRRKVKLTVLSYGVRRTPRARRAAAR